MLFDKTNSPQAFSILYSKQGFKKAQLPRGVDTLFPDLQLSNLIVAPLALDQLAAGSTANSA